MSIEQQITQLIHCEARLIDDGALDEWLDLFTADAIYWIPMDETGDPRLVSSIIYDDRQRLQARVDQAMRERRPAQTPRSRTVHMLSNLEIEHDGSGTATARGSFLCCEMREGDWRQEGLGHKQFFVGHVFYRLRLEAAGWLFNEKRIVLIDRHQPIEGLSFFL